MSNAIYCANCDTEATHVVVHVEDWKTWRTYLCFTCAEAYGWGQTYPHAPLIRIEEDTDVQAEVVALTD